MGRGQIQGQKIICIMEEKDDSGLDEGGDHGD